MVVIRGAVLGSGELILSSGWSGSLDIDAHVGP